MYAFFIYAHFFRKAARPSNKGYVYGVCVCVCELDRLIVSVCMSPALCSRRPLSKSRRWAGCPDTGIFVFLSFTSVTVNVIFN